MAGPWSPVIGEWFLREILTTAVVKTAVTEVRIAPSIVDLISSS
jgi:hypothetical protein